VSGDRITFNPLTKQWVDLYSDSLGVYNISTSPGWIGSTAVWTTTLSNDGSTGKSTETKVSDTETHFVYAVRDKSGKPRGAAGICKKSP
jgi:hypothetical protein